MKSLYRKWQWHGAAIALAVFVLSFLSWISFGMKAISKFSKIYNSAERTSIILNTPEYAANRTAITLNNTDNTAECTITTLNNVGNSKNIICESPKEGNIKIVFDKLDSAIHYIDLKWHDNIFMKSYLSKADMIITYYATGELLSSQVVLGSNNWLFYKSKTDGDSIGDYEGTNIYSQKEMSHILQTALSTQQAIEARGIKFAVLVAPNKENIYSEFMPDTYTHSELSRTDLLVNYLYDNGVNVVSPKTELLDHHLDFQLYYPYDTHWNQLGAYIGAKKILAAFDISLPKLSSRTISAKDSGAGHDLVNMIGFSTLFSDEIQYEIEYKIDKTFWDSNRNTSESERKYYQISHFINNQAKNQAKLFLVGDSFRIAMIPALGEVFSDVYVVYNANYTADMLDNINPDYLVVECVERYSYTLGDIDFLVK